MELEKLFHASLENIKNAKDDQGLWRLRKRVKPSEQDHMLFWLHNQRPDARGLCVGETATQLCFWASPRCSKHRQKDT